MEAPPSPRRASWILMASLAAGCAHVEQPSKEPSPSTAAKAPSLSKQRQMLSEGYSMLYQDAGNLDLSEIILYVKSESDAMKKVVTEISDMGGELKKDLERIAKDYPGVRIDLEP